MIKMCGDAFSRDTVHFLDVWVCVCVYVRHGTPNQPFIYILKRIGDEILYPNCIRQARIRLGQLDISYYNIHKRVVPDTNDGNII